MAQDELMDLVDENDQVIGTIWRSEYDRMVKEKLGYIRAADMFIQNKKGELWIPKRTADKRIAPNGLDYSVGGHVESGSNYLETVIKETEEELNLQLKEEDITFLKKFKPGTVAYFREVFLYQSDKSPDFNRADFVSARWITPTELIKELKGGIAAKSNLLETVETLFG